MSNKPQKTESNKGKAAKAQASSKTAVNKGKAAQPRLHPTAQEPNFISEGMQRQVSAVSPEKKTKKQSAEDFREFIRSGRLELLIGCVLVAAILLLSLGSILYTPYDINFMDITSRMAPPSAHHLFGTDNMGRDIFSRAVTGGRFTLLVAVLTVLSSTLIGCVLGLFSGYAGGIIDEVIMRVIDAVSSFPGILIALIIVTVLDLGHFTIIIALCIMFVPSFTRIVRTGTLQYKDAVFVRSSKVFGASDLRLLLMHVFPNIFPLLLSSVIIGLSNAILAESGMSYLGLGIQPPTPSWGRMLYEAQSIIFKAPWYAIAPGLMIVFTIVGFNCIGEGIRKKYL